MKMLPDNSDDRNVYENVAKGSGASEESRAIAAAAFDAARYSALSDDFENAVKEQEALPRPPAFGPPPPPPPAPILETNSPITVRSEIIDDTGKLSLSMMLAARLHWQAGTTTKSEKVSQVDSTYAIARIARASASQKDDNMDPEKMTLQEGSNLIRVLQDQNSEVQASKQRKYREVRWKDVERAIGKRSKAHILPNIVGRNVQELNPLSRGSFALMWNGTRFYIGEIMGLYKPGAHSRYGSVPSATSVSNLIFLSVRVYLPLTTGGGDSDSEDDQEEAAIVTPLFCCYHKNSRIRLHTHAKINHLLFNLGRKHSVFDSTEVGARELKLKEHAALCWTLLTGPGEISKEVKKLTVRIPPRTV
ncbi:hypothetical protein C8R43DRAFT_1126202 [Mycena crocata]|nr:hypothetical protein C8R43DRAFT_1126202 [Mycena crocata]